MKKMKRLFALLLTMVVSVGFSINTYAATPKQSEVTILPQANGIPEDVVNDIIKTYPNCSIVISNWVKPNTSNHLITPQIALPGRITKTTTEIKVQKYDYFVISVAKGSTKKLTTTWKKSLSPSCSISALKSSLSLAGTIERTYTKEVTFAGPPEGSKYNSREYRVKFYENRGTFIETQRMDDIGHKLPDRSGTWTSPHSYAEFSIDKKV